MIPAVVMAGGEGTRLRPLTTSLPKPLLPVLNRPMLQHVLRLLQRHGVTDAVITVQFLASLVRSYTGDGSELGMNLMYSSEEAPLGTAGSVKNAERALRDGTFLVISGDAVTDMDLTALIEHHRHERALVTVGLARVEDPVEYGGVLMDEGGRVRRMVEKPSWGRVVSDLVNTGIYVMEPAVLDAMAPERNLDWAAHVLPRLIEADEHVAGFVSDGYWEDVGTLDRYRSVQVDALQGKVDLAIDGFEVAPGLWVSDGGDIASDARVTGPVLLGRNVKVEAGSVVRGPTVVGDNTVIRAGADVSQCVIGDNAYVGEQASLHGALVGRNVELMRAVRLEEGSVVGNDCVIEEEALLGTDVRVFPAKTIEAGAVVRQSVIFQARGRRSVFGVNGVSGILNVEITPELVVRLTSAFASTLRKGATVVTARDLSRGARSLKRAVIAALTAAALDVRDLEHAPAPVARQVTASTADAGVYVRTTPGEPESVDIVLLDGAGIDIDEATRRVVDRVLVREEFRRAFPGEIGELTFPPRAVSSYVDHVVRCLDLTGVAQARVRVVVDAGNGAAGLALPSLLGALGADAYVVNAGLDEARPTDTPDESRQALARLGELVRSSRAAFGVRFDRTGDRLAVVDDRGQPVADDRALLIMLDLVAADSGGGSVALPVSSTRVAQQVAGFHGTRIRWTGVGTEAFVRMPGGTDDLLLAGDGAGAFVIPAVAPTPDALAAFARLVSLVARTRMTLGEIDDRIPDSQVVRARVRTPWAVRGTVMREISALAHQRPGATVDLTAGIKVIEADGSWCLLLPDPAEALLHVWAEAGTQAESASLLARWTAAVDHIGR